MAAFARTLVGPSCQLAEVDVDMAICAALVGKWRFLFPGIVAFSALQAGMEPLQGIACFRMVDFRLGNIAPVCGIVAVLAGGPELVLMYILVARSAVGKRQLRVANE
jgi:hypothetical protein